MNPTRKRSTLGSRIQAGSAAPWAQNGYVEAKTKIGSLLVLALFVACGGDDAVTPPVDGGTGNDGSSQDGTTSLDGAPPGVCPPNNVGPGSPPNGTVPGALTFPFPTIRNVTVEWAITGDADADGVVSIRYRKQGDPSWKQGLPLRRVPAGSNQGFSWTNRHAGSIFDLEPDTTYDVEAFLLDPDGGCEVRTASVKTRPIPAPMPNAPVKPATPQTLAAVMNGAQPGDVIELGAGSYPAFQVTKDGTAGKPIVIRANGSVTFTGDVSLIGRKYVHLTGVTVQGRIRINATVEVVITKNTVTTATDGIVAGLRSENDYIADNVVTGATVWAESSFGASGNNVGEGIVVTGPGHVIEHNKVTGFRDCLSLYEDAEAVDQYSIDFVENDTDTCADDAIEADFCFHDCRVVRNRFTNGFMAMSSQPSLGGPTYFIRNVAYNVVLSAFKLQRASVGDVLFHNTIVKNGDAFGIYTTDVFARQYARNNLFVGGPGGTYNGYSNGNGRVMDLQSADPSGDYDYDGYGSTAGTFNGRIGSITFTGLAEMKTKTTEKHGVQLDLGVFATAVAYPTSPLPAKAVPDLRIKPGSAAVDVGVVLPNVDDGWAGAAPDLGAYEVGQPLPAYGPR